MRLLRIADACATTGNLRTSYFEKVKRGLLPKPVPIGGRQVAWPEPELVAVNRARVAGMSDDQIKQLVKTLEAARRAAAQ